MSKRTEKSVSKKAAAAEDSEQGRWTSQRKTEVVLRLLRGEDLETLSRELKVTAARLSEWREEFLAAGRSGLKSRAPDVRDDEIRRLRAKVGELTMDKEVLEEIIRLRGGDPLALRRSRS